MTGTLFSYSGANILTDNIFYGATQAEWDCAVALFGDTVLPSVCNPNIPVSPNSAIASALKIPSCISKNGQAYGIGAWTTHKSTPAMVKEWSENSNLGICAVTRDIQAIDLDCATPELTLFAADYFSINIAQDIPLRVGKAGRGTIFLRVESPEPLAKSKITLRNSGGIIEFLGARQQTLLFGMHSSGVRYFWPYGNPTSVPTISLKEFNSLWQDLATHLGSSEALTLQGVNERNAGTALDSADPFLPTLTAAGDVLYATKEKVLINCPWSSEHSDPTDTEAAYLPATTTQPANYRCLHAHCSDRNIVDLHAHYKYSTPDFDDVALVEPRELGTPDPTAWMHDARWVRRANKNKEQVIDPKVFSNVQLALEYPQLCDGLKLQYDTFSGTTTVWDTNAGEKGKGYTPLTDEHVTRIKNTLSDNPLLNLAVSDKELSAQITVYQGKHGVDCAMNALETVAPWDGKHRLKDFAHQVMGTANNEYTSDVGVYMFLAITARIYLKDVSIDAIPVLIGAQKSRKSRLVKALSLVPEHYSKVNFKDSDADKVRFMAGRSVVNWDELSGVSRADLSAIKSFITETKDTIVPKYSNRAIDIARRSVIIATTNDQRFLKDPTGNRRFFPVNVGVMSEATLAQFLVDKEQYYAEALHMIKEDLSCIHDVYNRIDESAGAAVARRNSLEIANEHKNIIQWLSDQEDTGMVSAVDIHTCLLVGRNITKIKLIEIGQSLITLGYECVDIDTHCYKKILPNLE